MNKECCLPGQQVKPAAVMGLSKLSWRLCLPRFASQIHMFLRQRGRPTFRSLAGSPQLWPDLREAPWRLWPQLQSALPPPEMSAMPPHDCGKVHSSVSLALRVLKFQASLTIFASRVKCAAAEKTFNEKVTELRHRKCDHSTKGKAAKLSGYRLYLKRGAYG